MLGTLIALTAVTASTSQVTAKSAIIIDADSGKVLWERAADTPRYPASTTKIMTAMLLLERCPPGEMVKAPPGVVHVKPSTMNLKPGEKVPAQDMLYALMLRSANDGAHAVAAHVGGSI